jgi:hypothetical protein
MLFFSLGLFGHPHMDQKKVPKGLQVGETFGLMFNLKNKPLIKLLGLFFLEKWSETTRNQVFILFFVYHFGAIWAPPNGPKQVPEGPQVGGTYGRITKLKNKPLTKLLGPFY